MFKAINYGFQACPEDFIKCNSTAQRRVFEFMHGNKSSSVTMRFFGVCYGSKKVLMTLLTYTNNKSDSSTGTGNNCSILGISLSCDLSVEVFLLLMFSPLKER